MTGFQIRVKRSVADHLSCTSKYYKKMKLISISDTSVTVLSIRLKLSLVHFPTLTITAH